MRLLFLLATASTLLAQGPENVLLVVNQRSTASVDIAKYYSLKRSIPSANRCTIAASTEEYIERAAYGIEVEAPIRRCIERWKSKAPILYIVTTSGLPLGILGRGEENNTAAAVDSELAVLYMRMHGKAIPLDGPLANPYFKKVGQPFRQSVYPIYMVTRLTAYDVPTVRRMIDDGLRASNTGKFVFDLGLRIPMGDDWMRQAMSLLPPDRVVKDDSKAVLLKQKNVIGYSGWGSNDWNRVEHKLGFSWLPGSIAIEYVSTNGRTFKRPVKDWSLRDHQTLAADYLDEGATATAAQVFEPFLTFIPRPQYLFEAYYSGVNLAESFYASLPAISWMTVVVGDPLMRIGPPTRGATVIH